MDSFRLTTKPKNEHPLFPTFLSSLTIKVIHFRSIWEAYPLTLHLSQHHSSLFPLPRIPSANSSYHLPRLILGRSLGLYLTLSLLQPPCHTPRIWPFVYKIQYAYHYLNSEAFSKSSLNENRTHGFHITQPQFGYP